MNLYSYDDQALDDGYDDFEDEDEELDSGLFVDELDFDADEEDEDELDDDSYFGSLNNEDDFGDFD